MTLGEDGLPEAGRNFNFAQTALKNNRPDNAITQIKSVIAQLPAKPAVWRNLIFTCLIKVEISDSLDEVVIEFDMPDVPLPDGWT